MGVKEGGVRSDIKVVGLSNWKNEWRCLKRWQDDRKDGRKIRFGGEPSMVQFGHIFSSLDSLDMSRGQLDIRVRNSEGRSWLEV